MEGSSQTVTTSTTEIAIGASVSASVGIPDIVDVTATLDTTVTFTNELSSSSENSVTNQASQTVSLNAKAGQVCCLQLNRTSCTVSGSGHVDLVGTGWVWWYFKKQVQGHNYWSLPLSNLAVPDRTTSMNFAQQISGTHIDSSYQGMCGGACTL
ncbi:hypothetical protein FB45DRAFT_1034527 [Roridomyces roridus]|uniref:Uncharacterized protein n=1 Tax=Roridomyces roridus TaxID=1738132 RepID=A0AAD7BCH2_9AGAR|nr:hypothetical protein FB45DRAFT_1034527 [Roridomyces roridus]